jgi:hypothetical protein
MVGGELKDSGVDGTRGATWFLLISEWWWVVE